MATKPLTRTTFAVPSVEAITAIETDEQVNRAHEAHYRLQIKMRELEQRFETEASKLRCTFRKFSAHRRVTRMASSSCPSGTSTRF